MALWKLKPVRDGEIDTLHDMPTKEYSSWRSTPEKIVFISADFELDSTLVDKVVSLCKCDRAAAAVVNIVPGEYLEKWETLFNKFNR